MNTKRKSVRQWYKDLSFQKRLLGICVGVWVLPVVVVQIISMSISIRHLNEQIDELERSNLKQITERFSLCLESYTDIIYQIYADESIVKSLSEYHDASEAERASLFFSVNEKVKQFAETKDGIRCISLICNTGEDITYDKETGSVLDNIWRNDEDLRRIKPYDMVQGQKGIVLVPTQRIWDKKENTSIFFLGKELYDTDDLDNSAVATVIIGIRADVLGQICNADEKMQDYNVNFIVDAEGKVVSFPDEYYIGWSVEKDADACELVKKSGIFRGKELSSIHTTDKETGWTFYSVYDNGYMMAPVNTVQSFCRILLGLGVIFSVVLTYYTSRSRTVYMKKITNGIRQVGNGNFDVLLEEDRKDELGQISHYFNIMTQKVKDLIKEVMQISEKKKQAEIKALESQINPHFLYNTLDAINWMAIGKGEYEISKMLGNLGVILRYTMNQSSEMVPIMEAEEWLKSYVALYQLRYGNSFEFQISVEQEVRCVKIYKLLLQPVLENAILHGIKDIEGGYVRVDIGYAEDNERIYLSVEDNGAGMDEEQVRLYNRRDVTDMKGEHIGLANVFERIQLYYGEAGSWNISSMVGKGTIVMLLIPDLSK